MEQKAPDYPRRLYPEGASNLDNKDINHTCSLGELVKVREKIGHDVWPELKKSPVGIIAKLADGKSNWSGRTVHYLLCRQLQIHKKEIWSLVGGEPIRFSLHEFGEITGLNTDPVPTEKFEPEQCRAFWEELKVPYGVGPKIDELRAALEECRSWSPEKRKWLGLLALQAMGLYALHHNSRIPFESAKRVFDDDAMMNYPWGRIAFEVLVDSIKTLHPQGGSYYISGLSYALMAWAYESIACFQERFGKLVDAQEVPLLRWAGTRTRTSFENVMAEEIEKHGQVRVRHLVMKESLEDLFPHWPCEEDDQRVVNLVTDIHDDSYVGGYQWDVQRNEKKKSKSATVSECEPPTKKQKKCMKQNDGETADAEENKKEKNEDAKGKDAAIGAIIATLDKISAKFDSQDAKLEKLDSRFSAYDSSFQDLTQKIEHIERNIVDKVNAAVEERLKGLESVENFVPGPSPHNFPPQKSVTSRTLSKTPDNFSGAKKTIYEELPKTVGNDSVARKTPDNVSGAKKTHEDDFAKTLGPELARAKGKGGKGLGPKVRSEEVPRKSLFADDDKTGGDIDFVHMSPAKELPIRRGSRRVTKEPEDEDAAAKKKAAALKRKEAADLKKQKQQEAALKKKQMAELKKKHEAELKKKQGPQLKKTQTRRKHPSGRVRVDVTDPTKHVEIDDGEIADVTARTVAAANEVLPSSDEEEDDKLRNERIRNYRESYVQLSVDGLALHPMYRPSGEDFPYVGDDVTTCVRKNVQTSQALYDPYSPTDPAKLEKLIKFLRPFAKTKWGTSNGEVEFYRVLISERRYWPDKEAGWVLDEHISAYIRVLIKRSMRDPTPFWSDRIGFVDQWFLSSLGIDYKQFKLKPKMFKFSSGGYTDFIHGKRPEDIPTNKTWFEDVDHLYGSIQTGNDHWVAFHVDLREEKIHCYDPIIGIQTPESEMKMLESFRPMLEMFPAMANELIPDKVPRKLETFRFRRRSEKTVPQNRQVGDCGVYSLKFIECLALGLTFHGIHDENIQGLRVKMGSEILDECGHDLLNDMMKQFVD